LADSSGRFSLADCECEKLANCHDRQLRTQSIRSAATAHSTQLHKENSGVANARRAANAATLIISIYGNPAGAIAGSDFLRKPIMHRTRSHNCRTPHTRRTLPILLACLSALTLL
jgi:hypothetical protein